MTVAVLRADARCLPLEDASVDLIVTSPPYFGLRSYTDGGEHYAGQIGSEGTPQEWLRNLTACTVEWVRVLKPEGSLFVNLGDKYGGTAAPSRHGQGATTLGYGVGQFGPKTLRIGAGDQRPPQSVGTQPKSLLGLPWRYALACTDQLGLILRAEIVWCLSGGARVYARTPTGDRPVMLRDLVRSYQPQNIQLWNGDRWTQVLGWNRSPGRGGALELELRTGERIGCTPGHRWPTQRGVIRADEIRIGDVIQTARLPEAHAVATPGGLDDDDIGWLIGLYMAEGSHSEKMLQFTGHSREQARNVRLRRLAAAYHGSATVYQTSENGMTCNISGAILRGIIEHYIGRGRTAKTKRLRKTAWQRSDRFLRALVKGYLEGDGHYDAKNDRWRLAFGANDEWAADLRTLAARLDAKISLRRHQHTYGGRSFPGWRGEWRWTRSAHHNAKQDGEVVAIRASRAREFYDVGVADGPHLFALASGVLTHNSKPNGLPESVTDRVRRAHEQIFHLVKQPRYYAAVDEIREPHIYPGDERWKRQAGGSYAKPMSGHINGGLNPLGKLPGSVWNIPSQPFTVPPHLGVDHFAAFPMELPRRIILGWSPPGVCTACSQGRRPVTAIDYTKPVPGNDLNGRRANNGDATWSFHVRREARATITGYACACPEPSSPTRPAVVLDPFGGTGTTALVASVLGRHGITADLSADYCRLAAWRTTDPGERARAMQVPKPPVQADGQEALFTLPQ